MTRRARRGWIHRDVAMRSRPRTAVTPGAVLARRGQGGMMCGRRIGKDRGRRLSAHRARLGPVERAAGERPPRPRCTRHKRH